jgi:hypothetical protein
MLLVVIPIRQAIVPKKKKTNQQKQNQKRKTRILNLKKVESALTRSAIQVPRGECFVCVNAHPV